MLGSYAVNDGSVKIIRGRSDVVLVQLHPSLSSIDDLLGLSVINESELTPSVGFIKRRTVRYALVATLHSWFVTTVWISVLR